MIDDNRWQRRLRTAVGLPTEREQWPQTLRNLPADLEASSLTVPFSVPLLARARQLRQQGQRAVVIGLNGPVGAGKSTLARQLLELAPRFGLKLAIASIDDAYRPLAERRRILANNPFGVSRVPPGSHDVPLLLRALEAWRQSGWITLPRFNKTLEAGEGERDGWSESQADVLLLEGWLIGCRALADDVLDRALIDARGPRVRDDGQEADQAAEHPQPGSLILPPDQEDDLAADQHEPGPLGLSSGEERGLELRESELEWIPRWNALLKHYDPLWDQLDALWVLRPTRWTLPKRWRFQAEARQRRSGGGWLRGNDLDALVRSSLASLPPPLYQDPLIDGTGPHGAETVALLDGQRRCRWCGLTQDWPNRMSAGDQLSSDSASSATG